MIARHTNDKAMQAITVTSDPWKTLSQQGWTIYELRFQIRSFASMLPLFAFNSVQLFVSYRNVLPMSQP